MGTNIGLTTAEVEEKYRELGSVKATARFFNVKRSTVQYHLKEAGVATVDEALDGLVQVKKPDVWELPPEGEVYRYLLTAAQNNTKVNETFLSNLEALAEYYGAEILVSRFTYNKSAYGANSVKIGTKKAADDDDLWYDEALNEYFCDERVKLAPGLIFVGDMNVIPTAQDPLSGLDSFTGRASGIFPHAKIALQSVASAAHEPTKFNYTTGAVTRRNYIQKKAGQRAEFHHAYGAAIVEVESDGSWWVRQINADGRNRIYDLDVFVEGGVIHEATGPDLTPGDIHASEIDTMNMVALWGEGGVVDTLRPKRQFLHDLFSMRSRSHHEMKSFHRMYEKYINGEDSVVEELKETARICKAYLCRPWMQSIVIRSNHDEHLDTWLDRFDYKDDFPNAEFYLEAQLQKVKAIKAGNPEFNLLAWALKRFGVKKEHNLRFLDLDESLVTKRRQGGGIENGYHGDKAPNGARGTIRAFVKMARKIIIGHSHTAGILEGVYQTGTSSLLRLPYTKGPSSWSHTHCLTYANGKRTLFTVWKGKAWADRSGLA